MRVPYHLDYNEVNNMRESISKDEISDEYHVLVVPIDVKEYEFEIYNADKIERQEWNRIVDKLK